MSCVRDSLGAKLTAALQWALTSTGFESGLIEGVKRLPNGLEAIDYKALPTRDPVLHVAFADVGMASSLWSSDSYGPRVNVRSSLLAHPSAPTWLTSEIFYYGSDSSGDTAFSIPSDPRHRYANVDALIEKADEMPQVYGAAVEAIAERISDQLWNRFGVESLRSRVLA